MPIKWYSVLQFFHTIDSESFLKRITKSCPGHKRISIRADLLADAGYFYEQSNGAAAYYMMEYKQETPFSTKQIHILTDGTILSAL